ncbi:MAG: antibiotic biosynthesis monooxygenase [Candidatus Aminicenantes bacterium]|nr:antibiotic biosynthesis monooxygenase [Candidatus Aminicenantes bacterium]
MYARITRFRVRVEKMERAIQIYNESIVPAAKAQKGYRGIYLFDNKKTGEGLVLGLWDSEEDVIASEQNHFYQEQLVKVMNFFTSPPVREGYNVENFDLNLLENKGSP